MSETNPLGEICSRLQTTHQDVGTRSRQRLHFLDALRGFAALGVAWFHFTGSIFRGTVASQTEQSFLHASGEYGWLGVYVFFVISGFILPFTMEKSGYSIHTWRQFLKKRAWRIYPPYISSMLIVLSLWYISTWTPLYKGEVFRWEASRFLLHLGFLNDIFDTSWYQSVYWTLSIEFQFYILLAAAYPLLMNRRLPRLYIMVILAITCSAFIPSRSLIFHYAGIFSLGIVSAQYVLGKIQFRTFLTLCLVLTVSTAATCGTAIGIASMATSISIAFVTVPNTSFISYFGSISYSLYLLHMPIGGRVVSLGLRFAETVLDQVAVLILALCASVISAHLLYRFVELPAQQWASMIKFAHNPKLLVQAPDASAAASQPSKSS